MDRHPLSSILDYQPRTRIVFGNGSLEHLGSLAQEISGPNVLLVTDPGIVAAGHTQRALDSLNAAHLKVFVYDKVRENPTTADVARCVEFSRAHHINLIVGLGGGSSMDTAKATNFILTNGGEMKDYWGVGKATRPMLPLIAVPTTGGTGSECQCAALIADEVTHQKMACLDPKAAARVAILDPQLTLSQPAGVTACTGIDALAHALESAVTTSRNHFSRMFSRQAFGLIARNLPLVLEHPTDIQARGNLLMGSALAGLAIECSMLGAAHSAANPLTAHHGIVHGQAVGLMLPGIIRFNAQQSETREEYDHLAMLIGLDGVDGLVAQISDLLSRAKLAKPLRDFGIGVAAIPDLAAEAGKQWTAQFNPRPIGAADFAAIYEAAL